MSQELLNGNWNESKIWVIQTIIDMQVEIRELRATTITHKVDIAVVKVKAGIIGTIAGLIPASTVILIFYLKGIIGT